MLVKETRTMKQFSEEERNAMLEAYSHGDRLTEIAARFGLREATQISALARRRGIPARRNGHTPRQPRATLDTKIDALKVQLAALQKRRADQAVRFEWQDETTLVVHGVTEFFIAGEGLVRLRETIERQIPQRRVEQ